MLAFLVTLNPSSYSSIKRYYHKQRNIITNLNCSF